MALGRVCDINLARTATFSGGLLNLDNLKTDERYVEAPARIQDSTNLAASHFTATLASPRMVSLIAVLFHTLDLTAAYRLTVYDGDLDVSWASDWTPVYGRRNPSRSMKWEETNWWTGRASAEEVDLFKRHLWIPVPTLRTGAIKLEFDDHLNEAGFTDLGGLWLCTGISPRINFERGHELDLVTRGAVDMAPSGRRFAEDIDPYRTLSLTWAALNTAEAYRFFDMGARVRNTRTVLVLPDVDDPPTMIRAAFPAVLSRPPKPRFTYSDTNQVALTFEEILA